MKKFRTILLIFSLILIPTIVFASSGNGNDFSVVNSIIAEAFVSIHMSVFVLIPLSKLISDDDEKSKKIFWILFVIRVIILLIFDFFITTDIAIFDFLAVFFGTFIVILISSMTQGKKTSKNIPPNVIADNTHYAGEENAILDKDSPVVVVDEKYLKSSDYLLKENIKEEILRQGEDIKKFSTFESYSKNTRLNIFLGISSSIVVFMRIFNARWYLCLGIEAIILLIYLIILKNINIINVLARKAKKNPNEEIANIIIEAITNKKMDLSNSKKFVISILSAIIIPLIIFPTPRLIYKKYGDGYQIVAYTRGIVPQESKLKIPGEYKNKNIVSIGPNAFRNTDIKTIKLPENIESIEANAFMGCNKLKKIEIPESVVEIRASAFQDCKKLEKVKLPEGLIDLRAYAFKNDVSLEEINLPESLSYLGAGAFSHCSSIEEITIPKNIVEINGLTFEYCTSLRKINLHDDIISIHGETFVGDSNLDNVILPSKITEVRGNTFQYCTSLSSIIIPDGVTRIGGHAFEGCTNLSYVKLPDSLKEIGSSAFRSCSSLQEITIPYDTMVNERAFKNSPTQINRPFYNYVNTNNSYDYNNYTYYNSNYNYAY